MSEKLKLLEIEVMRGAVDDWELPDGDQYDNADYWHQYPERWIYCDDPYCSGMH